LSVRCYIQILHIVGFIFPFFFVWFCKSCFYFVSFSCVFFFFFFFKKKKKKQRRNMQI
jgi:hypothetical protein